MMRAFRQLATVIALALIVGYAAMSAYINTHPEIVGRPTINVAAGE